jgi:hypothetical protein
MSIYDIPNGGQCWRPGDTIKPDQYGGYRGEVHILWFGTVHIFSYPGGPHGRAFTKLEMHAWGMTFHRRLDRMYSHRWFRRLAGCFAQDCYAVGKSLKVAN